ncbi:MAG TPA: hypothetical protein VFX33_01380 [Actinomycetales bacterium]|nr:hypothetical protein [Actinomycetales bacterium]
MNDIDQVPREFASTVQTLRDQGESLPTAGHVDLTSVVDSGRRHARRRRTRGLAAGLAGVALIGGIAAALGTDTIRQDGAPATPEPQVTITEQDQRRPVTELYAVAPDVMGDAGIKIDGKIRWTMGDVPLYGQAPAYITGMPNSAAPPPAGFPPQGYPAKAASAMVPLSAEDALEVTTYSVHGGLPLEQDYCSWWENVPTRVPSPCEQMKVEDGILLRQDGYEMLSFIWSGGQVVVRPVSLTFQRVTDVPWDEMERIATDPRLRW